MKNVSQHVCRNLVDLINWELILSCIDFEMLNLLQYYS